MDAANIEKLILISCDRPLSTEEQSILDRWLAERVANKAYYDHIVKLSEDVKLVRKYESIDVDATWDMVHKKLQPIKKIKRKKIWYRVAAASMLFFMVGFYLAKETNLFYGADEELYNAVDPGSSRALLTLPDGEEVLLNDHTDSVFSRSGALVGLYWDGIFVPTTLSAAGEAQWVNIQVPYAGEYTVKLPDGSIVYLNSGSQLRYPAQFKDIRKVSMNGEAYFDVVHDSKRPFVVEAGQQEINVLGTSFNITAYPDESITTTTLVSGVVRLKNTNSQQEYLLHPNQQVVSLHGKDQVRQIDVEEVTAWKDGLYVVNDGSLEGFAKQVARWYDVEFDVKGYGSMSVSAILPRQARLSEVIKALEKNTGLTFKMKERRIYIK